MPLFCGASRRRDSHHHPKPRPLRSHTMSIFGTTNQGAYTTLKHLVQLTVALAPIAPRTMQKPRIPVDTSSGCTTLNEHDPGHLGSEIHEVLERIYKDLVGSHELLPKEKLAAFLCNVQGEASVDLENDHFHLGHFLAAMMGICSLDAVKPLPEKDLSKPLSNYFISSSHNTYLNGNQWASKSSPESYKMALLRGCRCIEIDVWNNDAVPTTRSHSKSPKPEHKHKLSGSSFFNVASTVKDKVEDIVDDAKSLFGDKTASNHSRSPSTHSKAVFDDVSDKDSVLAATDPHDSGDKLGVVDQAHSRSRGRSRLTPAHGEPIVTHGWTFTAPCGFRAVCEAVRDSAFVDNDLPIIISLEVHADLEQQEVMVTIMKEVWGDMLVQEALEGCDPKFRLPKLEDLRRRILIKVKRARPGVSMEDDVSNPEDERLLQTRSRHLETGPPLDSPMKFAICQNLGDLAIYTRSEPFTTLTTAQAKKPPHIFSINENKILSLYKDEHRETFTHNKSFFMRAFPAPHRVDSSNPDPSLYWRMGVQMVAMNWQEMDEGMMLNEGMFADENGWVLKPPGYQSTATNKAIETQDQASQYHTLDLTITVFAGQHIQAESDRGGSTVHPCVKAELHVERQVEDAHKDGPAPDCKYKQKTEVKRTDHPSWGHKAVPLKFHNIPRVAEELSFIRLKVEDTGRFSENLLSWACIRLDRLRTGYRVVRLMDMKGREISGGKLLVKIEKTLR